MVTTILLALVKDLIVFSLGFCIGVGVMAEAYTNFLDRLSPLDRETMFQAIKRGDYETFKRILDKYNNDNY